MKIPDKLYDILKWVALICIPAVLVFLSSVLPVLGVSVETTQAIVTIGSAVATLMGALLGISTVAYHQEQAEEAIRKYEETDER